MIKTPHGSPGKTAAKTMALPATVDELRARCNSGEAFNFIFFWEETPEHESVIGANCLSQWYEAPLVIDGVRYLTAEHFMMAEKARLFNDQFALQQILAANHPRLAKQIGRKVLNFDEKLWNQHSVEIVTHGNFAKFSQNQELQEYLITTHGKVLVEASPYDKIWGIGLARNEAAARNPTQWQGLNLLGFSIMKARAQLFEQLGIVT